MLFGVGDHAFGVEVSRLSELPLVLKDWRVASLTAFKTPSGDSGHCDAAAVPEIDRRLFSDLPAFSRTRGVRVARHEFDQPPIGAGIEA